MLKLANGVGKSGLCSDSGSVDGVMSCAPPPAMMPFGTGLPPLPAFPAA